MYKRRIVVYDFETTGFFEPKHQPIQAGCKVIEKDGSISDYMQYISCPFQIPEKAQKIHGITDDILKEHGKPIKDVFGALNSMINQPDTLIVGHNIITFDNLFLNRYFTEYRYRTIGTDECFDTSAQFKASLLNIKKPAGMNWGEFHFDILGLRRKDVHHNLALAVKHYNVSTEEAIGFHNASADVNFTYLVLMAQFEALKNNK